MTRVFQKINNNHARSSTGYEVWSPELFENVYKRGDHVLEFGYMFGGGYPIYELIEWAWQPPHEAEPISEAERAQILDDIVAAFDFQYDRFVIELAGGKCIDHSGGRYTRALKKVGNLEGTILGVRSATGYELWSHRAEDTIFKRGDHVLKFGWDYRGYRHYHPIRWVWQPPYQAEPITEAEQAQILEDIAVALEFLGAGFYLPSTTGKSIDHTHGRLRMADSPTPESAPPDRERCGTWTTICENLKRVARRAFAKLGAHSNKH